MDSEQVFNLDEVLDRVDQDWDTFQMIAELLIEHGPNDLAATGAALAAGDADALARSAHRLKGAIAQFCAPAAYEAARQLEVLAKAGDLAAAAEGYATLDREWNRLLAAIRPLIKKGLAA
jgi:histidine phosphotransfer protein HptB